MDDLDEDDVEETMQHTVRDIQVSTVNVEQDNDATGHEDEVDMVADRGHEREKEEQVQLSSSFIKFFHVIFDGDDLHMCAYFLIHVLSVCIFFYSCTIGNISLVKLKLGGLFNPRMTLMVCTIPMLVKFDLALEMIRYRSHKSLFKKYIVCSSPVRVSRSTQQGINGLEGHNKVLECASSLLWFFTGITGLLTNPS
jgi:hypothetical protein